MKSLHGNNFWDWLREEPQHEYYDLRLDTDEKMIRVHMFFYGQVQGVGFRYVLKEAAGIFSITGRACNVNDASVEAWMQGRTIDIENMTGFCQVLSPYILIDDIKYNIEASLNEQESDFITF